MKIETGKTYVTREGKRVTITSEFNHKVKGEMDAFYIGLIEKTAFPYDTDGKFCRISNTFPESISNEHKYDIVEESA